jgi:hypothetical protein
MSRSLSLVAASVFALSVFPGARPAEAALINLTAVVAERGSAVFPYTDFNLLFNPGTAAIFLPIPPGNEERAAIEFDLSAIPADALITSVSLRLVVTSAGETAAQVHGYTGNGSITNADVDADLMATNLLATFGAPSTGPLLVPLPPGFIQNLLDLNEQFAGLGLRDTTIGNGLSFFSVTMLIPPENRPQLAVEYAVVPEPATLLLVASGCAAAAGRRFRRLRRPASAA